jgi:hypothetical protein
LRAKFRLEDAHAVDGKIMSGWSCDNNQIDIGGIDARSRQ